MQRRHTKQLMVGDVSLGGGAPIRIQSMTNTKTSDVEATLSQIRELANAGCEIVRVGVTFDEDVVALGALVKHSPVPLIADIQYDYRHAIDAVSQGINGIRLNPGYIEDKEKLQRVADHCLEHHVPIRVGVNSGSVNAHWAEVYGGVNAKSLAYSALDQVQLLEECGFDMIKVAIKASDVSTMIEANRLFATLSDYPLHLGVTESGTPREGVIKSSIGIGTLLAEGIGDTLRVSLTADPVEEVRVAKSILQALGLRREGVNIISCPTCSRTNIDLIGLAEKAEELLENIDVPLTVAIMGCAVNGPGEAKQADIGISGGNGEGLLFKKGQIIKKVPEEALLEELLAEVQKMIG